MIAQPNGPQRFPFRKNPTENNNPGSNEKYPAIEKSILMPWTNPMESSFDKLL